MRYAGYIRVSDQKQVDGFSLDAQEKAIRRYVEDRKGSLVEMYVDAGESARTTKNRDAFIQMRTDAGKGKFDALVVHKFDRLNRSKLDATIIKALLRKDLNIRVFSVTEAGEDDNGPMGSLLEAVLEGVAEYFSKNLASEVKKARKEIAEQGLYYGSHAPFGYTMKDLILLPHPDEAPIIAELYEHYASGDYSLSQLVKDLDRRGIKTSAGNDKWSVAGLRYVLINPVYYGMIEAAETLYRSTGEKYSGAPMLFQGTHPPLISKELAIAVRDMLTRKRHNVQAKPSQWEHLLPNLVYCGDCMTGYIMETSTDPRQGKMYQKRSVVPGARGKFNTYRYYGCRGGHKLAKADEVDAVVVRFLLSGNLVEDWRTKAVTTVYEGIAQKSVEDRVAEIRLTMERMDNRWDAGFFTDKDEYFSKRKQLQELLDELKPLAQDNYERAIDLVYNFPSHWEKAVDLNTRRELVSSVVQRVFVQEGQIASIIMYPGQRHILADFDT